MGISVTLRQNDEVRCAAPAVDLKVTGEVSLSGRRAGVGRNVAGRSIRLKSNFCLCLRSFGVKNAERQGSISPPRFFLPAMPPDNSASRQGLKFPADFYYTKIICKIYVAQHHEFSYNAPVSLSLH
ncbi:hypothetical protein BIY37_01200 [Candidatus Brocadia sapporoensis]|uniref:Uncharacterized protein n=1 Tax=Candidatus Brocadia sapporoensis TaxID=392547 RepID=A0A1V6M330_9BACT|nr:hypothetical protein [Candidatus Brocadia sapporoensis]OQD46793.1 hypothetical protein BIY37_01200 [Candidatus Brocadia sapporoensis]